MSCERSRKGKESLTEKETLSAYQQELRGRSRIAVALSIPCSERTLARAYERYGLQPPKRGKYRKRAEK